MGEVIVEYDYIAKEPDELTIKKGDIIKDVVKKQGGWWEGILRDKKGMFPDNFVRALDKDSSVVLRNKKDVSRIRQCRVVFSYNQDHEDELNLNVGDVINIVGEEEEGWWRGVLNGKEGVFPSNFVEEIVLQPPHPKPSSRDDITSIAGDADLKVPKLPIKPSKQLCEAKFPYKAQNEDELSLKEGDIITLVSKDSQDPGWWKGELNGKVGVFPDNFVALISSIDDRTSINKEENKSANTETGAIKPSSIALQRKSLEAKHEKTNGDPNIAINKTPPLPGKKPIIPIKKSPSSSGTGIFSEIKKKIVDVVDGATGSKGANVKSEVSETKNNSENAFDQVERRSMLTDIRATRAKPPGRRLPTAIHKDEETTILNGNAEHLVELDSNSSSVAESENIEKRRVREWEKHKAPWLEEMKLNQAKRTSTSPGPESKLKLTPTADGNAVTEELPTEKQNDLSKSMPPMDLSKALSGGGKPKVGNDTEKSPVTRERPSVPPSMAASRQSLPLNLKESNPVAIRHSHNMAPIIKDNPAMKPPKAPQTSPSLTTGKHSIPQKSPLERSNDSGAPNSTEGHEPSHKQYVQLLERLQRLEATVESQRVAIEELRNKLQIETDMRMMLQEKVLHKL